MTYEAKGAGGLDYHPCRYGTSKLVFRGPKRKLDGKFCAVLGGNATYGRFIERPFPAMVEEAAGLKMVNFGCMNAGVDVYLNDPGIVDLCDSARVTVVQVMGAHNMTNRFYAVHPRRNDRFLRASSLLKTIYREVDFTEFHFTRHMLRALQELSPERFEVVADELKAAWVARMRLLLRRITGKTVLLWVADHAPGAGAAPLSLDREPLLVDRDMLDAVSTHATEYVEAISSPEARETGTQGMRISALDEAAAAELPGPAVHAEVARTLEPVLRRMMS
ncbi:hypothetical protein U879_08735 [Defluviimonas sp. 20V17]|uniref:DUF6473 domain-containing protein n=1 Tax=Allgaiera indica TaxID=765699 RepID=A0AAN4UW06_9RHOB|nr:DUF6473 family protein [Allgaiera indica]KDB04069.1 hypothetical protein U879_08735 [Defluviimonas sp. 20V17]GHE06585.1 hypothetical protein GCM10008024_41280 [Allgaiera indica]SDX97657.1 hypothetical protein SAMN05444006_1592 [Allgaiera indica]